MSHFSVLVCVPAGTDPAKLDDYLTDVTARWDENRDVEPYRDYEDGSADGYWWVASVRRGAEHHRNGTGLRPHNPGALGWSSHGPVKETPERQRAAFAEAAKWAERLGDNPTWETVVRCYNELYHPGNEVAVAGDTSDSERLHYDAETGRAYTVSTRNPESMWDYWRIGGRWKDYFVYREQVPGLIWGERSWDSPEATPARERRCDGGPISGLDFEALRSAAALDASGRYDRWEEITATRPPATAWEHFAGLADLGELTWDEARRRYNGQPAIAAAAKEFGWGGCPVAEFLPPREEYVAEARRGAVPGYALVTLDREWMAPGRMGWFGMSSEEPSERSAYRVAVNQYLEQVGPATILVVLDCHI